MTPTQEYIQKAIKEFREKFVNDHNKGEERFLRGLFIEEFESFLEQKLRGMREELIVEIMEEGNKAVKQLSDHSRAHSRIFSVSSIVWIDGMAKTNGAWVKILGKMLSSQETAKEEE